MPTYKTYTIGFLLSVALTLGAYFSVVKYIPNALVIIFLLAIVQLFIQLIFFLHLNKGNDRVWNLAVLFSTFSIILIVVAGSLWIMGHLNYNMSPEEMKDHIFKEEMMQKH